MKKWLLIGLVIVATQPYQAHAQRSTTTTSTAASSPPGGGGTTINYCAEAISSYQAHADSTYAPLDKNQIPTGIFYDRISKMAGLVEFNAASADTSNFGHFRQAIYELHAAAYNTAQLPCQLDVREYAQLRVTRDTVAIGILHYRFNYLDSTAVANNLLYWDNATPAQLHDVAGRPRSPYLTREATVVAALVTVPRSGVVTFRLDPALFFTNTGRKLNSAAIDFGDGNGARTCLPGQALTISYTSAGVKVLRYTLHFSDGTQQTTCSSLAIATPAVYAKNIRPAVSSCYALTPPLSADIVYARNSRPGIGEVEYFYSTEPGTTKTCSGTQYNVTKPVVLVDGFDHEDDRKAGNLYADGLAYDDAVGQERNLGEACQRVRCCHPELSQSSFGYLQ